MSTANENQSSATTLTDDAFGTAPSSAKDQSDSPSISQRFKDILFPKIQSDSEPDKGYAWVICFLSFWIHFFVLGVAYIFGIYQQEYKVRYPEVSNWGIAVIGSLTSAGIPLFAIPVGKWVDRFGHTIIGLTGGVLYIASFVLAAYSTSYVMLVITQGFLLGMSLSFCYFPALSILSQWFVKRQGLATGIAVAGAGIGGLILSPFTRFLITSIGLQNSLVLSGFLGGFVVVLCSFFLKRRAVPVKRKAQYGIVIRNTNFQLLYALSIIGTFGYFVPFFYVPSFAVQHQMSVSQGALLIGILNGASALGRVVLGQLSDRIGHINALLICLFCSGLSIMVIWPFATFFATLLVFVITFGFFVGGYISIIPTVIVQLFGTDNIAGILGLVYSSTFFGTVFGPPLAGSFIDMLTRDGKVEYLPVIMFSGSTMLIASGLLAIIKYRVMKTTTKATEVPL